MLLSVRFTGCRQIDVLSIIRHCLAVSVPYQPRALQKGYIKWYLSLATRLILTKELK